MPGPRPPPPFLFADRLATFLQSNLSPQIQSALLITTSGKLLSYASPTPIATLRTQATVAASLWTLHAASALAVAAALPPSSPSPSGGKQPDPDPDPASAADTPPQQPTCLTLALAGAVAVIRRLTCGLLFVCIGPAAAAAAAPPPPSSSSQSATSPTAETAAPAPGEAAAGTAASSPTETDSVAAPSVATGSSAVAAAGPGGAGMVLARRHVEELARWLDGKLGRLTVLEEGVGWGGT